jgi:hypothetical protein
VRTTVNGHPLPPSLLRLIDEGWGPPPSEAIVRALRPAPVEAVQGLVACLSVKQMEGQLEVFSGLRDFGRDGPDPRPVWDAYGFESSARVGGPVHLPLLDLDRAVPILLLLDQDTAVWLDYRPGGGPRVVVPVLDPNPARPSIGCKYLVVAETCPQFLRRLYGDSVGSS